MEKRAVGALLKLSRSEARLAKSARRRKGTARAPAPAGREPPNQQEGLAPPARRPPPVQSRARGTGSRRLPVKDCAHLQGTRVRDVCELPQVFQAPGASGRPSGRSCIRIWQ